MQIFSNGDNLHEMSNPVSGERKKTILKCRLLKILPRVLSTLKLTVFTLNNGILFTLFVLNSIHFIDESEN